MHETRMHGQRIKSLILLETTGPDAPPKIACAPNMLAHCTCLCTVCASLTLVHGTNLCTEEACAPHLHGAGVEGKLSAGQLQRRHLAEVAMALRCVLVSIIGCVGHASAWLQRRADQLHMQQTSEQVSTYIAGPQLDSRLPCRNLWTLWQQQRACVRVCDMEPSRGIIGCVQQASAPLQRHANQLHACGC
jgi:hypothetical protein